MPRPFSKVRFILLAPYLLISMGLWGQPPQPVEDLDDSNNPIVKQIIERARGIQSLKATVECKVDNQQANMKSVYNISFESRGDSYKMKVLGMEIYSDGVTRWQYIPAENEVTISSIDQDSDNIFDKNIEILRNFEKEFKVRYMGEHKEAKNTYYDLALYPRQRNMPYISIRMSVKQSTLLPERITYQGRDGVNYIVTVKSIEPNAQVPINFIFQTAKYKDIQIVDLREYLCE